MTQDGNVSILLGTGAGTFAPPLNFAVGQTPNALAVRDFDGDGRPDIVVTNDDSNDVSILLGIGNGTFQPAKNVAVGHGPFDVAVADFNGDGLADLAVTTVRAGTISVLPGKGDGTFGTPAIISTGTFADSIAIRALVTRLFERRGDSVQSAADGAEAIVCLDAEDYDLLILDLMMPRTDGLGVLAHLRERSTRSPRIIVMTAAVPSLAATVPRDQIVALVTKPFEISTLLRFADGEALTTPATS